MPTDFWGNAIFSLVPTIVFGLLFWLILRSIVRADRGERKAYAAIEVQERARFEAERLEAGRIAASRVDEA
jgi:hypothetical protein